MPFTLQALMASYNSKATVEGTIRSALEDGIPVLVVDDGSTDQSDQVVALIPGVTLYRQTNAGPSVARNRAILESGADFVMFLDSDDLLRPGYREAFERSLQAHPDADVFVCGMEVIDEAGQTVDSHEAMSLLPTPYLSALVEPIPTNGIIVRRSIFNRAGLFDTTMKHAEDWDLWLRLAATTDKWVRMDHKLAVYRLSGGSLSKNGPAMWRGIKTTIRRSKERRPDSLIRRHVFHSRSYWQGSAYVYSTAFSNQVRSDIRGFRLGAVRTVLSSGTIFLPHIIRDLLLALRRRTKGGTG